MFASTTQAPPANPASPALPQSEVERILTSVAQGDAAGSGGDGGSAAGQEPAARHDFPQVSSFNEGQTRKLRLRCEWLVNSLAARFSNHLRMECSVQMTKLDTVRFQPFVEALANPTFLTLLKMEPLEGVGLLNVPARLALAIVDREMGGQAVCQDEARDLTQIEARLAAKVVNLIAAEWCAAFADLLPMRPVLLRHESSARFLNLCSPQSLFLGLGLEVRIAQSVETIHLAFPQTALEPLLAKLDAGLPTGPRPSAPQTGPAPGWNPALNNVPVQVSARWRGLTISARQLGTLKAGDVLPLRPATPSLVEISIGSKPKFTGQLGAVGRELAVKIVGRLKDL
jgi:flagellar motor switch protein FliM